MNNSTLHQAIIRSFLDRQRAPRVAELAERFGRGAEEVRRGLRALADDHGVVLHPRTDEVWIAHPFSSSPTTCVVHAGTRRWWGNCAWCSLGVVQLAGGSADLETRLGGLGDAVTVRVRDGRLLDRDFVVHFPIAMQRAWDNVVYTCSVMLLFRDEQQVERWCLERGIDKGDVRPLEQVWGFAAEWYSRHGDPGWRKWSVREAADLFARHGLTGAVWSLPVEPGRF